jgi:hypothetical protein
MSHSDANQEAIARLLLTSLTDNQLLLIGEIAVLWNNNEFLFEHLIWRAAGWEQEIGELVTADLLSASRETLAKNIIERNVNASEWKEYSLATVEFFTEARITRNNLVHSLPALEPGTFLSSVGHKRSAKSGKGVLKTTKYDISAKALSDFTLALNDLRIALRTSEIRLRGFASPPTDDTPITLLEISEIRNWIDRLHSQHRSEGKA